MNKTEKELAFLRDLYIETDFTERFTDILDDNFKFADEKNILYINAGAGNHALALRKKLDENVELLGVTENEELLSIARHKTKAVKATNVDFSTDLPNERYDAVIADASFVQPSELPDFLSKAIELSKNQTAFFLPTASSFGEVFSLLWETFLELNISDKGSQVERLISEIPTVSDVEETAQKLGLSKIETITKNETFEFENGRAFVNSPLAADFLLPRWLDFLDENGREQIAGKLAEVIDEDCAGMSFQFSVKATLLVGKK